MVSLDAEVCMWIAVGTTLFLGPNIMDIQRSAIRFSFVGIVIFPLLLVCFEIPLWHAALVLLVFILVTALMAVVFDEVIRDAVPKPFWHRAYVLDVGLLNGIVMWQIINL